MEPGREGEGMESWVDRVSSRIWERVVVETEERRAAVGGGGAIRGGALVGGSVGSWSGRELALASESTLSEGLAGERRRGGERRRENSGRTTTSLSLLPLTHHQSIHACSYLCFQFLLESTDSLIPARHETPADSPTLNMPADSITVSSIWGKSCRSNSPRAILTYLQSSRSRAREERSSPKLRTAKLGSKCVLFLPA